LSSLLRHFKNCYHPQFY